MFKLKVSQTDKLFSLLVRMRDKFTCQRCGKKTDGPSPYIQCAHFYGRKGISTRYDFENCVSLCGTIGFPGGCHGYFSDHPNEFVDFMKKRLGPQKYDSLVIRAHTPIKNLDEKLLRTAFKIELKRIENEEKARIIGSR